MAGILHWAACLEPTASDISMLERIHYTHMRARARTQWKDTSRETQYAVQCALDNWFIYAGGKKKEMMTKKKPRQQR